MSGSPNTVFFLCVLSMLSELGTLGALIWLT